MKNRVFKKICGVMLSAMLMITMAIPVLADCGNSHNIENGTVAISYINASGNSHQVKMVTKGKCKDCEQYLTITNTYNEGHTPDKGGKCTKCGYQM